MNGIELVPEYPVDRLVDLGVAAERAGFDAIFASSHYNNRDPFVVLDRIAAQTDRVLVSTGVSNPYETHPVTLASRVATLAESSENRCMFGIGAGDRSTLSNLGIDRDRPLQRVLETIQVARRLWAGERVTHDGSFVARDAGLNYDGGDIPVYVGAQGPHMIRMSAKHANGVLLNASHPDDFAWARRHVNLGLDDRPTHFGDLDVVAYSSVSVSNDVAAAREAARPPVAFIVAGANATVLERHRIDPERAALIGEHIAGGSFSAAFDAVTQSMIDAFSIAGTTEMVAERVADIRPYVTSVVFGSPLGPEPAESIELAADALDRSTPR